MSAGRGLYTPEVLGMAMRLVDFPWAEALPLHGAARSRSCGSTITIGLAVDDAGRITALGLKPHACAVGQAAAAIFLQAAQGLGRDDVAQARAQLSQWLTGERTMPDWPGLDLLEAARGYPARHGAILLAWDAALDALKVPVT
ncbi:iron-sulfur cluster assembly scaffold protein [Novosphingobium sp. SL115]|uniref:iron-sulfur cluster assembly scaffold protein n=1 Tax=Novosphingobium sp. SL115 TaxID=2995150 RepID=UPI00227528BB|nr:iron-sulfur cluster assembly scaffold protein [Novosphingobium sp. SL115]MCY1671717.1 iron-sulfur cluster assembly scaffold protein [Novosphingobium sp. SL115]